MDRKTNKPSSYVVSMFPYPSGDLHMGHAEVYTIGDAIARFARLRGNDVLHPIGWDSFGLPAENAALKRGLDPQTWTYDNIAVQAESFRKMGISFDWNTRLHTSDPEYYRWNQWLFLRLYEHGLAYRDEAPVNWCPADKTVLANEQVIQGNCERCGARVVRKTLAQWFFRTTRYAQRLLDDMAELEGKWPDEVLAIQRNWIGRSAGTYVDFAVVDRMTPVRVFTTRPDTLFGATFLVVAADASLADELCAPEQRMEFETYRELTRAQSDIARLTANRPKTGVALNRYAINPVNGERIPIYAADYVLAQYGIGAVMAVPAHDQRDLDFAVAMGLPVRVVVDTGESDPQDSGIALSGNGVLINSARFSGMRTSDAAIAITAELATQGAGESTTTFRLRDWLVSRQRYWGTPIPIIHCENCGIVPVPDDQLPVLLPTHGYQLASPDGKSPLESAADWVLISCPSCGNQARRDTDTMDTFVDSSWYFLRYPDPHYEEGPFNAGAVERWLPVAEYIGGKGQETAHLIYARFLTKALHDMGLVHVTEPFARLTTVGTVLMDGKAMSKSRGNLIKLQDQLGEFGPDAVRVAMAFAGPPQEDIDWADVSPAGAVKWLSRVSRLAGKVAARPADIADENMATSRVVHRLIAEVTTLMEDKRFNVAIARLMELTSVLSKAIDAEPGSIDPSAHKGTAALVSMLFCFAPHTATKAWHDLGNQGPIQDWPVIDETLLVAQTVTCIIQVNGKVRDRLEVSSNVSENELRRHALNSGRVQQILDGRMISKLVIKPPRLVSIVCE